MISYKRWINPKFIGLRSEWPNKFIGDRRNFWSATGRGALDYLINNMRHKEHSGVMLPAFVAEGVILPFQKNKIPIHFYKLNKDLSPNLDSIQNIVKYHPEAHMIVVIHYFGIEIRNLDDICNLAETSGLMLIEDCAQALGSKGRNGVYLGCSGDVSLFSFPKSVPVPYGCLLVINNTSKLPFLLKEAHYRKSTLSGLALVAHRYYIDLQGYMSRAPKYQANLMQSFSKLIYLVYYKAICEMKNPAPIDTESSSVIMRFDYQNMINQRYQNLLYLHENIPSHIVLNFTLFDDMVLTGFPLILDNRNYVKKELKKRGIDALSYVRSWSYVPVNSDDFVHEKDILSRHLLLPISENYSVREMKYIVHCLKDIIQC